jgi:hypothetical protein
MKGGYAGDFQRIKCRICGRERKNLGSAKEDGARFDD